jgi:hypothetical protein
MNLLATSRSKNEMENNTVKQASQQMNIGRVDSEHLVEGEERNGKK